MLVRFLDPDAGRITVDGLDLRELRLADLRREIVLVDQSPHLFNASIAENISYARPEATRQELNPPGAKRAWMN